MNWDAQRSFVHAWLQLIDRSGQWTNTDADTNPDMTTGTRC